MQNSGISGLYSGRNSLAKRLKQLLYGITERQYSAVKPVDLGSAVKPVDLYVYQVHNYKLGIIRTI